MLGLNQHERPVFNAAKATGVLQMSNPCTEHLVNRYYRMCWDTARPYIAVNKHGDKVAVDLEPVASLANEPRDEDVVRLQNAMNLVLKEFMSSDSPVVIENYKLEINEKQLEQARMKGLDGANEGKRPDSELDEAAILHTKQRSQAKALAERLWLCYTDLFEVPNPEEVEERKRASKILRRLKVEARLRRDARRLAADALRAKTLPRGSLQGFLAADQQGTAQDLKFSQVPEEDRAFLRTRLGDDIEARIIEKVEGIQQKE